MAACGGLALALATGPGTPTAFRLVCLSVVLLAIALALQMVWSTALTRRLRRAAAARGRALRHLDAVVASAVDGIIAIDHQGCIESFNPAAERIFGYRAAEVIGRNVAVLMPEPWASDHDGYLADYLRSRKPKVIGIGREVVGLRKDGSTFPLDLAVSEMADGARPRFVGIARDVTKRKREMMEFAQANADLTRRNAELAEFAWVASHDLQEPVRKLVSFADLLVRDVGEGLSARAARDLDFIVEAAHRTQRLVQDLLAFTDAGNRALQLAWVSLEECVDEALAELAPRIAELSATIERVPLPTVRGDRSALVQLYRCLLDNALRFSDGPPRVHLTAELGGDAPILGVRDEGKGIAPEYVTQVFLPFQRLQGGEQCRGSGIGLAICHRTVERHGGRIWVESPAGKGAHLRFTLGLGVRAAALDASPVVA